MRCQLTSGKFAGQKFDAPKVVALGLMSEQALPPEMADTAAARPSHTGFTEATLTEASPPQQAPTGTEIALQVLESTMIGGEVSEHTNQSIHQQLVQASEQNTSPGDMLNLLTALVMGSPEFQVR